MKTYIKHSFTIILGLFVFGQLGSSQDQKPLTLDDYAQWNRIRNATISPDGAWMTYSYAPNEGDSKLHVRKVDGDTVKTITNGKRVAFSADSKWVAYLFDPTEKEAEKLKKQKLNFSRNLDRVHIKIRKIHV